MTKLPSMTCAAVFGWILSTAISCVGPTDSHSTFDPSFDNDTSTADDASSTIDSVTSDTDDSDIAPALSPQYRLSPAHTGVAAKDAMMSGKMRLVWQSEAYGIGDYSASKSSPAVDKERLYIGVDDGRLLALSLEDGSLVWQFKTHRWADEQAEEGRLHYGIHGSPAFDGDKVYIGDYDGYLYAVDKETGALRWERKLGDSIGASPTLTDGAVYMAVEFSNPEGKVFVVSAKDGEVLWSTPFLGNHPHSSVSLDVERGLMFVGANNGRLFCFDTVSHLPVWTFDTDGEIKSTPAVSGDTVYVTSWDSKLHAVAMDTGIERFSFPTGDVSMSSPTVFEGRVYFGSHDTQLYAVDAASQSPVFTVNTDGAVLSSPTVAQNSGLLAVGSKDRTLYIVDAREGTIATSFHLPGGISSVPVIVGNTLYVNDDTGTVTRFDFE